MQVTNGNRKIVLHQPSIHKELPCLKISFQNLGFAVILTRPQISLKKYTTTSPGKHPITNIIYGGTGKWSIPVGSSGQGV